MVEAAVNQAPGVIDGSGGEGDALVHEGLVRDYTVHLLPMVLDCLDSLRCIVTVCDIAPDIRQGLSSRSLLLFEGGSWLPGR